MLKLGRFFKVIDSWFSFSPHSRPSIRFYQLNLEFNFIGSCPKMEMDAIIVILYMRGCFDADLPYVFLSSCL